MDLGTTEGVFISYLNDDNMKVNGFFTVLELSDTKIHIRQKGHILILPLHRILKIKLPEDGD